MKDVAIVGMACRFPGAENYDQYWDNLINGINSVGEIPQHRLELSHYYSENKTYTKERFYKWGGFLKNIDQFDNRFFDISSREAKNMDPQQRMLLEETWHCIEDSGIPLDYLQQKTTAVFVGSMTSDYLQESVNPAMKTDSYTTLGCYDCILSNRISYFFNWSGPSISIGAACASSLVALHQAKCSLRSGESDFAIAASVNLNFHPWKNISFSRSRMLSPSGQCRTFDKDANGYVPGEGIGVVLLQPVEDALREKNHIYGILKGSAVNHCGHSQSLTAPKVDSQKKLILNAYKDAMVNPKTTTYVEAHGTGTSLGDPIEVEALNQAFREHSDENHFCQIGSVKTNIGHLEASAGMAALIKVLLMIKHRRIPALANFKIANPIINFKHSPFLIATELSAWKPKQECLPLRASINSFGIGGINSHIVVEELKRLKSVNDIEQLPSVHNDEHLFLLSTKQVESMNRMIRKWMDALDGDQALGAESMENISATLKNRVTDFEVRLAFRVQNHDDLKKRLRAAPEMIQRSAAMPWCLHIGNQKWQGIDPAKCELLQHALFRHKLQRIMQALQAIGEKPVREPYFLDEIKDRSTPVLFNFIIDYCLLSLILDLGFKPELIIAEQSSIWTGLVLSGAVTLPEALSVLCARQDVAEINVRRPTIPLKTGVNSQVFLPFQIRGTYLRHLLDHAIIHRKDFKRMVRSARLIITSQYTFRRFIKAWDADLAQFNKDIESLLFDDKYLTSTSEDLYFERLLLLVAIESSLLKISKKWNLTADNAMDDKVGELVDLLADGVLSKRDFLDLVFEKGKSASAIAEKLNSKQHLADLTRPYQYLRRFSQNQQSFNHLKLKQSFDEVSWLNKLLVKDTTYSDVDELKCFRVGETIHIVKAHSTVVFPGSRSMTSILEGLLQNLWLAGVNIKWNRTHANRLLKKTPLPGYEFLPKAFWLIRNSKEEVRSSDMGYQASVS